MFPTQHHTALVEFAFKAGGSSYWKSAGSGGLSAAEVSAIDYGSRLTDTLFGTGQLFNLTPPHVDPPITAIVSEAPKHAMTPGDMSVDVARAQAYKWISENTGLAREKQRASCMKNYEAVRLNNEKSKHIAEQHRMANNGRPIPSPPPVPIPTRTLEREALTFFGKACHTYMDACSPAHYGWQRYEMPVRTTKILDPETGIVVGEQESYDWVKFILEALAHKKKEDAPPTIAQRDEAALYMRAAFLTTFGNWWFSAAIKSEKDRNDVYDFLKRTGQSWNEDIIPKQENISAAIGSLMPPRFGYGFTYLG